MIDDPIAISTRVCQSFIRVGQIELYGNRTKVDKDKINELKLIIEHLLNTDYKDIKGISFEDKIYNMLISIKANLISMTSEWIRVG